MEHRAAAIKILAEQRAGALVKVMRRAQGKRDDGLRLTLKRSGISRDAAHRWQAMAAVPEAEVRRLEAELTGATKELTSALIYETAQR